MVDWGTFQNVFTPQYFKNIARFWEVVAQQATALPKTSNILYRENRLPLCSS